MSITGPKRQWCMCPPSQMLEGGWINSIIRRFWDRKTQVDLGSKIEFNQDILLSSCPFFVMSPDVKLNCFILCSSFHHCSSFIFYVWNVLRVAKSSILQNLRGWWKNSCLFILFIDAGWQPTSLDKPHHCLSTGSGGAWEICWRRAPWSKKMW